MTTINTIRLANRVEAINSLYDWLNQVLPKLKQHLDTFPPSMTVNHQLYKKDKELIHTIIANPPKNARAWFKVDEYGIDLMADIHYKRSHNEDDFSVEYHKEYLPLFYRNTTRTIDKLQTISYNTLLTLAKELPELEEQHSKLRTEINDIKRKLGY